MPPGRDNEEYERRRQQLIDGALQVFAAKGFEKATNKDIAAAAQIRSPGLIYHYFRDKAHLFEQVMEERGPALQFLARAESMLDRPPREVLTAYGESFLHTLDNRVAMSMFRIVVGESFRRPSVAEMLNRVGPARGIEFLRRYISHQIEVGNLRAVDPGAAARCFVGPFVVYVLTREVFVQPDARTLSAETMVRTAVDMFLDGLEVHESDGDGETDRTKDGSAR